MSRPSSRKTNIFDNLLQQLEELVVENTIHMEILLVSRLSRRKTNIFDDLLIKASEKSAQQLEVLAAEKTTHIEILLVC